ncbi:MAG: hypothetical protein HWN67_12585 [Candidatus Helarchaeota archaeon]|nr:hypothetical protein [Candidatus Helarchaeota archaeon]
MPIRKSTILNELKQISRKDLEDIAKKRIKIKVRDDFKASSWKKVKDLELIDKLAEICFQNNIYVKDLLHLKVLYKNKDDFLIQRKLGDIHYFEEILKSAVMKYGPSKSPDYEELARIAEIVYEYIDTVRFDNALDYPVYPNSSHLPRIISIAGSLSTIGQKNLKTEESYRNFLQSITEEFKEADMAHYGDVMSR